MYAGWADKIADEMNVCDWVDKLKDRFSLLHDMVMATGLVEREQKKDHYDKTKTERSLEEGDKVLCRIPGFASKLEDVWEGPYTVLEKLGEVNCKVARDEGKRKRLKAVHIKNVKNF